MTNDHVDDMMKNIDERDMERDKKMKAAEDVRVAAQRKFEQYLARRLENLELAQKAASSAATAAQETASSIGSSAGGNQDDYGHWRPEPAHLRLDSRLLDGLTA